ncbi:ATP-binding protein [Kibdelosporangium persicum]|uniref:Serine phosphatase RsbU, regulator of sigma subunit n=2 Tax=Kibdelosporangium persicum TaxID=2698649 RepID=A0ABX2F135_9PSEU|nr:Serine phosphatase RsbU, regulator of sigma subunit [Kibdelosporangium persicum]
MALADWGASLPEVASRVVADADIGQPHVYLRFSADPGKLGTARREITRWAGELGMGRELIQDIVLALDEATTNAVEHAYLNRSGPVTLFAGCDRSGHCAWTVVSDCGKWRQPKPRTEPSTRGRGLLLMAALADEFDVTSTVSGTTVVLGWPLTDYRQAGGDRYGFAQVS